jgi:hypothetical protein
MNTTAGLEELKTIFNRSYMDGRVFTQEIQAAGYKFKEKAPWGSSVVMERGDDKFIIDIQNGGVRHLIYRCERLNLSVNLVVEGRKVF